MLKILKKSKIANYKLIRAFCSGSILIKNGVVVNSDRHFKGDVLI
jgi:hypothetical protein